MPPRSTSRWYCQQPACLAGSAAGPTGYAPRERRPEPPGTRSRPGGWPPSPPRSAAARAPRRPGGSSTLACHDRPDLRQRGPPSLRAQAGRVHARPRPLQPARQPEPVEDVEVQRLEHASLGPLVQPPPASRRRAAAQLTGRQEPPRGGGPRHEDDRGEAAAVRDGPPPPTPPGSRRMWATAAQRSPTARQGRARPRELSWRWIPPHPTKGSETTSKLLTPVGTLGRRLRSAGVDGGLGQPGGLRGRERLLPWLLGGLVDLIAGEASSAAEDLVQRLGKFPGAADHGAVVAGKGHRWAAEPLGQCDRRPVSQLPPRGLADGDHDPG